MRMHALERMIHVHWGFLDVIARVRTAVPEVLHNQVLLLHLDAIRLNAQQFAHHSDFIGRQFLGFFRKIRRIICCWSRRKIDGFSFLIGFQFDKNRRWLYFFCRLFKEGVFHIGFGILLLFIFVGAC